jgi:hypothetical protein
VIGGRSLALLTAVIAVAVTSAGLLLDGRRALETSTGGALISIGLLSVVVGTLVFRLFGLGAPSASCFTVWRRGRLWPDETPLLTVGEHVLILRPAADDAWDLPPVVRQAIVLLMTASLAFASLSDRALALWAQAGDAFAPGGAGYCPDGDDGATVRGPRQDPGCALIRRAHALGYTQDLGPCEAEAAKARGPCALRRRDEPVLHYAMRRWRDALAAWQGKTVEVDAVLDEAKDRVASLRPSLAERGAVVRTAARAAHHLFTTLPAPPASRLDGWPPPRCADTFGALEALGRGSSSERLEHALGQLLFELRYRPPAADCREVHVHWDAPADACARAAELLDPRARAGLTALRHRADHRATLTARSPRPIAQAFSVQCLVVDDAAPAIVTEHALRLDGLAFTARSLTLPPSALAAGGEFELTRRLAELLSPGFRYHTLLSEADIAPAATATALPLPVSTLTALEALERQDLYLRPPAAMDADTRAALAAVYPFARHLANVVDVFRHHYLGQRGRL